MQHPTQKIKPDTGPSLMVIQLTVNKPVNGHHWLDSANDRLARLGGDGWSIKHVVPIATRGASVYAVSVWLERPLRHTTPAQDPPAGRPVADARAAMVQAMTTSNVDRAQVATLGKGVKR